MISNNDKPVKFSLGKIPNPLKLVQALKRPDKPFVMINLLSFNERASGEYDHLSGVEAYEEYARSVQKAQAPLGSRLLWSGNVQQKLSKGEAPIFHSIGLLEYASPKAFLEFLTKGGSNTKARSAGLQGQWLIAATTLEEGNMPDADDEGIVLVELCGGLDHNKVAEISWQENRNSITQTVGGRILWHGHCDHHIIGTLTPGIENVLVTWFANTNTLEKATSNPKRIENSKGYQPYITYSSHSTLDLLPELR